MFKLAKIAQTGSKWSVVKKLCRQKTSEQLVKQFTFCLKNSTIVLAPISKFVYKNELTDINRLTRKYISTVTLCCCLTAIQRWILRLINYYFFGIGKPFKLLNIKTYSNNRETFTLCHMKRNFNYVSTMT